MKVFIKNNLLKLSNIICVILLLFIFLSCDFGGDSSQIKTEESAKPTPKPSATLFPTPTNKPTCEPLLIDWEDEIRLAYCCHRNEQYANTIGFEIRLLNGYSTGIDLSKISIKYCYTKEGSKNELVTIISSDISNEYIDITPNPDKGYVNIAFTPYTGMLGPKKQTGICLAIWKEDNSYYIQNNDPSWDPSVSECEIYSKISVYNDEVIIWGSSAPCTTPQALPPPLTPLPGISLVFPYSPYEYPSGIRSVSGNQEIDNSLLADMCQEYDLWKQTYVTANGAFGSLRIKNPEGAPQYCTESEGIGFGMLLAIYMDDPELFDNLYNYAQICLDGNGLMHQVIHSNGTVIKEGSNTNADIDMGAALVFAARKWGKKYESHADELINNIYNCDVYHSYGQDSANLALKPSDSSGIHDYWANTNPFLLTASFKPAFLKIFAAFTGNNTWDIIASVCYNILESAADSNTGLIPDWCLIDGKEGGNINNPDFQEYYYFDAARVPHNIGLDYFWFGETRALSFCTKITAFFDTQRNPQGKLKIWNAYYLTGNFIPAEDRGEDTSFTGCAGAGAMAAGDTAFAEEVLEYIKDFKMNQYYQDTYRLLNILILSGNYPNLFDVCTQAIPIPSPTAARNECTPEPPPPLCPGLPKATDEPPGCPTENLVDAGCFDTSDYSSNFTLKEHLGTSAYFDPFFDNCMHIKIGIPGTQHWNVQITQWGIQMLKGVSYTLSFDARTNVGQRRLTINIGEGVAPYGSYTGEYDADLNCEWQHFTVDFTPDLPDNENARFEINAGKYYGDVFIDNIILIKN